MELVLFDNNILKYIFGFLEENEAVPCAFVCKFWKQIRATSKNWKVQWKTKAAFHKAVSFGNKNLIEFFFDNDASHKTVTASLYAAKTGDIKILELLVERGYPLKKGYVGASAKGYTHVLDWLQEVDEDGDLQDVFEESMSLAARFNHLEVLKWFEERITIDYSYKMLWSAIATAAIQKGGYGEALDYALDGSSLRRRNILSDAIIHKNFRVMERFWRKKDIGCKKYASLGLKSRSPRVVEWLWQRGISFKKADITKHFDNVEMMRVLVEVCDLEVNEDDDLFVAVVSCKDPTIFKFLKDKGCILDKETSKNAVLNGNLVAAKWLFHNDCPFYENVAKFSPIEKKMFEWLKKAGFNLFLKQEHLEEALKNSLTETVLFLIDNKCPYNPEEMEDSIKNRLIKTLVQDRK
ncbi:putative ankyrin repeat protein [Tunisvirus fontaine2]|uniref:Putative ankyrin repeat protein n=1 Tax=Tunisvirus fontaine2 TaxID=1421067 RepID=V9SDI1_9VIRU|nr:putative ankyrin repeat protein [Tunisvirus fontaine2]AHC54770.1 putative ankyrin repeat protein [Tunisvirus fontaine2]